MTRQILLGAALAVFASTAVSQQPRSRPYTEGTVTAFSYVRTKPGKFDEYMKYLQGPYKTYLEALKKDGIIVSYGVYSSPAASPQDWDLLLTIVYKNMGAMDGLDDRTDAISSRVFGSQEQENQQAIDRGSLRDILGSRLVRELLLK